MNIRYFEVGYGNSKDPLFGTSDYDEKVSIAIRSDHCPSFEEIAEFCNKDNKDWMKNWGVDSICSVTELTREELEKYFDYEKVDRDPVLRNDKEQEEERDL